MNETSGYLSEDTIAAIATGLGGAIAIIRISGPRSFEVLVQITQIHDLPQPGLLHRVQLLEGKTILDDCLIVRFVQPKSFTGEDLVEFHLHGSIWNTQAILSKLINHYGLRQALPGEFSFRAVRNGKMNLFQAQAIAEMIQAKNEQAAQLAIKNFAGHSKLDLLKDKLLEILTQAEAMLDFIEEDIPEFSIQNLKKQIAPILEDLEKIKRSYERSVYLQEGIQIACIGLPNAGKSSFFNSFLEKDRSIVTKYAGTTRDVIEEHQVIHYKNKKILINIQDTAGLHDTKDPIEQIGIQKTLDSITKAHLILFVIDLKTNTAELEKLWDCFKNQPKKIFAILTKSDHYDSLESIQKFWESYLIAHDIYDIIITSHKTQQGISEALEKISQFAETLIQSDSEELTITQLNQFQSVQNASHCLKQALKVNEMDLLASDLKQTLYALNPLLGLHLTDEILKNIFSNFCIGK